MRGTRKRVGRRAWQEGLPGGETSRVLGSGPGLLRGSLEEPDVTSPAAPPLQGFHGPGAKKA